MKQELGIIKGFQPFLNELIRETIMTAGQILVMLSRKTLVAETRFAWFAISFSRVAARIAPNPEVADFGVNQGKKSLKNTRRQAKISNEKSTDNR